jgi:flagellar assembly factor FliW
MTVAVERDEVRVTTTTPDDSIPVVDVPDGLPGFPDLHSFAFEPLDESGLLLEMRSLEDERVRFVVVPSVAFFPDYAPEIDDLSAAKLGLVDDVSVVQTPLVLLVVNVGATLDTSTVNLMAPVVINGATRVAAQVVLDDPSLPLRAPLPV